jgi:acyl-CoA thioesterase-1
MTVFVEIHRAYMPCRSRCLGPEMTAASNLAPHAPPRRAVCYALAAALLLAAACDSTSSSPRPSPSPLVVRRVVVLGDSLAVSPSVEQSFPSGLQIRIARQGLPWMVTNAGVSGDTTADGLRRVEALLKEDVGVLIAELGANDGLRGLDIATIRSNLATVVEIAQRHNVRVLLCGMETPPTHGLNYSIAFHSIFTGLAQQYRIALIPFLLADVLLMPDLLGSDGVHPNAAGAERIAETVWPYLEPLLRQ